jgi:hypothetical protein
MPYQAEWYLLHQVIDARIWGLMTLDDLDLYLATVVSLLTDAQAHAPENIVHLLLDTLEAESIPPLYLLVKRGVNVMEFKNRGTLFLIARNTAIRSVIEVTAHISRDHFPLRVFKERQAALDALASYLAKDALR